MRRAGGEEDVGQRRERSREAPSRRRRGRAERVLAEAAVGHGLEDVLEAAVVGRERDERPAHRDARRERALEEDVQAAPERAHLQGHREDRGAVAVRGELEPADRILHRPPRGVAPPERVRGRGAQTAARGRSHRGAARAAEVLLRRERGPRGVELGHREARTEKIRGDRRVVRGHQPPQRRAARRLRRGRHDARASVRLGVHLLVRERKRLRVLVRRPARRRAPSGRQRRERAVVRVVPGAPPAKVTGRR